MLISTQSRFHLKEKNNDATIIGKINLLLDNFLLVVSTPPLTHTKRKKRKGYLTLISAKIKWINQ